MNSSVYADSFTNAELADRTERDADILETMLRNLTERAEAAEGGDAPTFEEAAGVWCGLTLARWAARELRKENCKPEARGIALRVSGILDDWLDALHNDRTREGWSVAHV